MSNEVNDDSVTYGIAVLAIMRKLREHEQANGSKDRAKKMALVEGVKNHENSPVVIMVFPHL